MPRRGRGAPQRLGGRRTAVVRANYVRTREADAHRRVSASAEYYTHDKDIDGSYKGELEGFNSERDDLSRDEVKGWHQENFGEHPYCYRTTLSPGTDLGPEEMREFVRDAMSDLEAKRGHEIDYVAYVHDDHEHPHAHVMFYEDTTLRKGELNEWRSEATVHAHDLGERYETERLHHETDLAHDRNLTQGKNPIQDKKAALDDDLTRGGGPKKNGLERSRDRDFDTEEEDRKMREQEQARSEYDLEY